MYEGGDVHTIMWGAEEDNPIDGADKALIVSISRT
jgi:hypothetical protein